MTIPNFRWVRLGSVLSLLAGALSLAFFAIGDLTTDDPLIGAPCDSCHLSGDETDAGTASLLYSTQERLCDSCHPGSVQASHPSGVSPSMLLPVDFPLDWKGDLTCSSCHFIHQGGHGRLRVEARGLPFCSACHGASFFEQMPDQGGSLLVSGHLDATVDYETLNIDPFSVQCMACHWDEGEAPNSAVTLAGGDIVGHADGGLNHPVGVPYAKAVSFGGYRPVEQLPKSIVLPGGNVSCVSCHQGYSQEHGAMALPMRDSNLCFQCHDL